MDTKKDVKEHTDRLTCAECENVFNCDTDLKKHKEEKHSDISSPVAKKRKQNEEEVESFDDQPDNVESLKTLEKTSFEEMRLSHRVIETKVNEDELEKMEKYDESGKKDKVKQNGRDE